MSTEADMQYVMSKEPFDSIPTDQTVMLPVAASDLDVDASFSWEIIRLSLEAPLPMQEAINRFYNSRRHLWISNGGLPEPQSNQQSTLLISDSQVSVSSLYGSSPWTPSFDIPSLYIYYHAATIAEAYMHYPDLGFEVYDNTSRLISWKANPRRLCPELRVNAGRSSPYKLSLIYPSKNWETVGRVAYTVLVLGLNWVGGAELNVKQCLPSPKDRTDCEEQHRTFWVAYCVDCCAIMGLTSLYQCTKTMYEEDVSTPLQSRKILLLSRVDLNVAS